MRYLYLLLAVLLTVGCTENKQEKPSTVIGTLVKHDDFPSQYVASRNIHVWLPVGYHDDPEKYSVLYMHDGQNMFDKSLAYAGEWKVDEHIQKLMDSGEIRKTIVVGIWNTAKRFMEYQPQDSFDSLDEKVKDDLIKEYGETPLSNDYLKFIVEELKPFIDSNYRTRTGKQETFMMGSSMGGLISIYALAKYPDVFGGIAAMSTHWPISLSFDIPATSANFVKYLEKELPKPGSHKIYFDFGTETLDAHYEPHQNRVDTVLEALGYSSKNWITRKFEGKAHNEYDWEERIDIPLLFLLKKKQRFTANVMAPLDMKEDEKQWDDFKRQIRMAKEMGVGAVSVDVWWGLERTGDNKFEWAYYDRIFDEIEAADLRIVPIMSFHGCGGYPGGTCNVPVPEWIWGHFENKGITRLDMHYQGENGAQNIEAVSLWQDDYVIPQYIEFMNAFEERYAAKASIMDEINISMGASGELRYPAYTPNDALCDFPTRGCFQAYSPSAMKDFQNYILKKYDSLEKVNAAWGTEHRNISEIIPPNDGTPEDGVANDFVQAKEYVETQYGRDFMDWYHESLINHGRRMLDAAIVAFDGAFAEVELGMKIAGIHWQMSPNAPHPRITEMAVGLIPTSSDYTHRISGYGYGKIINLVNEYKGKRKIALHFTNLESDDQEEENGRVIYSQARTLLKYVATAANDVGITIKGENAMAHGIATHHGWDNINQAYTNHSLNGITILRLNNVTDNEIGQARFRKLIQSSKK